MLHGGLSTAGRIDIGRLNRLSSASHLRCIPAAYTVRYQPMPSPMSISRFVDPTDSVISASSASADEKCAMLVDERDYSPTGMLPLSPTSLPPATPLIARAANKVFGTVGLPTAAGNVVETSKNEPCNMDTSFLLNATTTLPTIVDANEHEVVLTSLAHKTDIPRSGITSSFSITSGSINFSSEDAFFEYAIKQLKDSHDKAKYEKKLMSGGAKPTITCRNHRRPNLKKQNTRQKNASKDDGTFCTWEMQIHEVTSNGSWTLLELEGRHNEACLWKLNNPRQPLRANPYFESLKRALKPADKDVLHLKTAELPGLGPVGKPHALSHLVPSQRPEHSRKNCPLQPKQKVKCASKLKQSAETKQQLLLQATQSESPIPEKQQALQQVTQIEAPEDKKQQPQQAKQIEAPKSKKQKIETSAFTVPRTTRSTLRKAAWIDGTCASSPIKAANYPRDVEAAQTLLFLCEDRAQRGRRSRAPSPSVSVADTARAPLLTSHTFMPASVPHRPLARMTTWSPVLEEPVLQFAESAMRTSVKRKYALL